MPKVEPLHSSGEYQPSGYLRKKYEPLFSSRKEELEHVLSTMPLKMRRFVINYLKTGQKRKSWRSAYKTRFTDLFYLTIMQREKVKRSLSLVLDECDITEESIVFALKDEAFSKPSATPQERKIRLEALKFLAHLKGMFNQSKGEGSLEMPVKIIMNNPSIKAEAIKDGDKDGMAVKIEDSQMIHHFDEITPHREDFDSESQRPLQGPRTLNQEVNLPNSPEQEVNLPISTEEELTKDSDAHSTAD